MSDLFNPVINLSTKSNMKKVFISILALLMASQIRAQVAHWAIHPYYDSIYFAVGANLIITDSLNEKMVWTLDA